MVIFTSNVPGEAVIHRTLDTRHAKSREEAFNKAHKLAQDESTFVAFSYDQYTYLISEKDTLELVILEKAGLDMKHRDQELTKRRKDPSHDPQLPDMTDYHYSLFDKALVEGPHAIITWTKKALGTPTSIRLRPEHICRLKNKLLAHGYSVISNDVETQLENSSTMSHAAISVVNNFLTALHFNESQHPTCYFFRPICNAITLFEEKFKEKRSVLIQFISNGEKMAGMLHENLFDPLELRSISTESLNEVILTDFEVTRVNMNPESLEIKIGGDPVYIGPFQREISEECAKIAIFKTLGY